MDEKIDHAICGMVCGECHHFGENCTGCSHVYGRPFWLVFVNAEICPIYDCCINEKGYEHCGQCSEFICERFHRYRDRDISDEEHEELLAVMKENLLAKEELPG